jgi:hypothetical protein
VNEDGILKLPAVVIQELDRRRGWISRAQFVLYLLERHSSEPSAGPPYATRDDLQELSEWVRGLLLSFLDLLVTLEGWPAGQPSHCLAYLLRRGPLNGS